MSASLLKYLSHPSLWRWCLGASVVVTLIRISPFAMANGNIAWYLGQFGPIILATGAAVLAKRPAKLGALGLLLMGWVVLAALSTAWSVNPANTLAQSVLLAVSFAFLWVTLSSRWIDRRVLEEDFKFVFWFTNCLVIAGFALWAVAPDVAMGDYGRFQGVFPNPNYTAIAAATAMPFGVYLMHKAPTRVTPVLVLSAMAISLATIVISGSRGAMVAAMLGVGVAFGFSRFKRQTFIAVLAGVIGVGAMMLLIPSAFFGHGGFLDRGDQNSDFSSGRFAIWQRLADLWLEHPYLGIGYRTVETLPESASLTAHNIFLSVLVELGLVGFLLFTGLVVLIVLAAWKAAAEWRILLGGVIAVITVELTESSLFGFGGPTALLSWLAVLAAAASAAHRSNPELVTAISGFERLRWWTKVGSTKVSRDHD